MGADLQSHKNLKSILPIITLRTPLAEIPRDWLLFVEPHVIRGSYLPCWIWDAMLDGKGYPIIRYIDKTGVKRGFMVRRLVASIFWIFPKEWYVQNTCKNRQCINPAHLIVNPKIVGLPRTIHLKRT